MARQCPITGKMLSFGHNVSHSVRRTKRKWKPNFITKTFFDPITGAKQKIKITAKGLKTLMKQSKFFVK